jgi:HEPN domain-containing protein
MVDGSLSEDLASADALSEYAVESRYPPMAPGIEDDIDTAEAREAVALARLVREAIHPRISAILPGANPG